jgi:HEPN domain-containing protein
VSVLDGAEFASWRSSAERTLDAGAQLATTGSSEWACFLAEQAAQLGVEGVLHGLGEPGWGHDLTVLVANLHRALAGAEPTRVDVGPAGADDGAARPSRHDIPARYPDAHPAGPPAAHYRSSDATDALADARAVLAWADAAWELVRTASGPP